MHSPKGEQTSAQVWEELWQSLKWKKLKAKEHWSSILILLVFLIYRVFKMETHKKTFEILKWYDDCKAELQVLHFNAFLA